MSLLFRRGRGLLAETPCGVRGGNVHYGMGISRPRADSKKKVLKILPQWV